VRTGIRPSAPLLRTTAKIMLKKIIKIKKKIKKLRTGTLQRRVPVYIIQTGSLEESVPVYKYTNRKTF
jgi:hypothetical protein